jgi:hypothetical protein
MVVARLSIHCSKIKAVKSDRGDMGTTVPFDVANNTILFGQGATPSCIVMPIVP